MLKCKSIGILLIKKNSKIICSYDMLHARTFLACRKFLGARYAHVDERGRIFFQG